MAQTDSTANLLDSWKGRLLVGLVTVLIATVAYTWKGLDQRVEKLDERARESELEVQDLRTNTRDLPQHVSDMRRLIDEMGKTIAELNGLVHGIAQLTPPRRRAELYGLRNATIEQVKLGFGGYVSHPTGFA